MWNNCFIKNDPEILPDRTDFPLQEHPEDNLLVTISLAWYNGSYTTVDKPIKSLELHYTMIQFLISIFMEREPVESLAVIGEVTQLCQLAICICIGIVKPRPNGVKGGRKF